MLDEDITENTTAINWECHDGTDESRISIRGIAEKPSTLPAESRAARQRRELREQLVREHIDNIDPAQSIVVRIFKKLFGRARQGGN
jgi:hypothetical protein